MMMINHGDNNDYGVGRYFTLSGRKTLQFLFKFPPQNNVASDKWGGSLQSYN